MKILYKIIQIINKYFMQKNVKLMVLKLKKLEIIIISILNIK